ncbi:MAG: alpha/beta fold hydrolase [Deltaproteobacteria bacterium]|nr:alpha/beta fold hydrolase [Deltaproteobacteria bacterium]
MPHPDPAFAPLPAGFSLLYLEVAGLRLALAHGGQGPPLVLVHGLGGSLEDFFPLLPWLAPHRTCLALDLPGFGRSAKPDTPYTMAWFAEVLADLARELGLGPTAWLGHSMGGQVLLTLATRRPARVAGLGLICPAGGMGRSLGRRVLLRAAVCPGERTWLVRPNLAPLVAGRVYSWRNDPTRPALAARLTARWSREDRPHLERALVRAARATLSASGRPPGDLPEVPLLIIGGRDDTVIQPREISRLAAQIGARARLAWLPGTHMLPYTHAASLAGLLLPFFRYVI